MGLNSVNTFCKVVIYNYFVLTLILCQIWLWLCSITFTRYFMWDFIVRVVCVRECQDSSYYWRPSGFCEKIREKLSRDVSHVQSIWLECEESWQLVFASNLWVRPFHEILSKHSILLFWHICSTISSPILFIPTLPIYCKECF